MDIPTFEREAAVHRRVYESLREKIKRDCAGKYVVLTQGRLYATTPTFEEAEAAIQKLRPIPEYYLIFPAEMEPSFTLAYEL